jgi:hypothetical protein
LVIMKGLPSVCFCDARVRSWPVADATVAGVRNWSKFRHQLQARLTVVDGATVARTRRPLPRKAAVAADMVWCL